MMSELFDRRLDIFRFVVDTYLQTGSPTGSRTISDSAGLNLSPASIRNVLAELESEGLLYAPHTSAGRLPTDLGLRYYIDGLLQIGHLTKEERQSLERACQSQNASYRDLYEQASAALFGLSQTTSLVVAPTADKPLKQIQFVRLERDKALVVLVHKDGSVSNRLMALNINLPDASLLRASNFLNNHANGKTLAELKAVVASEIRKHRETIDSLTQGLINEGLAVPPSGSGSGHIIVRGQSSLLNSLDTTARLEEVSDLFALLEEQETISKLLDTTRNADGVQIYVGTENKVFAKSGWSMILSPYKSEDGQIVGALGVIGPTRLNYGRIIPMVDYTARIMERILGNPQ